MFDVLKRFLALEAASGLILMAVAVIAMIIANSPAAIHYETIFAPASIATFAINDGLMAVFFLLIGLEIKREIIGGSLAGWNNVCLPVAGAVGGVIVPALIYSYFNHGTEALRGWAIPTATDIAFSLGVLSLLGSRVPLTLKIFLMALAVIDDLVAVLIIAFFYTAKLNLIAFAAAAGCMLLLRIARNQLSLPTLLLVGCCLWVSMLFSGVHPTIAGVILGLMMPMQYNAKLIEKLHAPVAFFIVPLFAFANAGVSLAGIEMRHLAQPVTLGIMLGLFFGKPLGIFISAVVCMRLLKVRSSDSLWQLCAVSMLAGIGFTMSLFITALASAQPEFSHQARLGVIAGSVLSGLCGACLFRLVSRPNVKC